MNDNTEKLKIFLGASREGEKYLQELIDALSAEFDVIPWYDRNVFSLNNQVFLDSLIKQSYLVDFAVFLATADDLTQSRGENQYAPRDNVIFEFGLFLQSLGKERCFMLAEENVKILSDMAGISLNKFSRDDSNTDFAQAVDKLRVNLRTKKKHITSLVTTGLAYGYYKNFVARLAAWDDCEVLSIYLEKTCFKADEYEKCTEDTRAGLPVRDASYLVSDSKHFFDCPTTLEVIEQVLHDKSELSEHEKDAYRQREINNFAFVIERLMERETFRSKIRFVGN